MIEALVQAKADVDTQNRGTHHWSQCWTRTEGTLWHCCALTPREETLNCQWGRKTSKRKWRHVTEVVHTHTGLSS
jgi:hypothetical protein